MPSLAALQAELAEAQENLDTCIETIKLGIADEDTEAMKSQFEEEVASLKSQIAAQRNAAADTPPPPPPPAGDSAPKYDMSKHPKFRTASPDLSAATETADAPRTDFKVGDSVMAKYSADKQWYPATVVSKTGSSADPVYTVNFTGYNEKENKRKFEVRAAENKKRKAEAAPEIPGPPRPSSPVRNGNVISAAASIDTSLVPQKKEPSKVSDGPTRMAPAPKKLKGSKQLEKTKSSWNSWQANGPKKTGMGTKKLGKDSQFRTPDLPNAKGEFSSTMCRVCDCLLTFLL
jgi:survival-of-motor-neuron-related-splicing factor 30